MWSIDKILHNENFNDLSKTELLEVILILRNELKYHRYRKDKNAEELISTINTLKNQTEFLKKENERLTQINKNFHTRFGKQLSIWERIKGRIDLSK